MEELRLAQQLLQENARAEAARRHDSERARGDGQRIHYELQNAEAQAAREKEKAMSPLGVEDLFKSTSSKTVVPAQAGTHAEHAEPMRPTQHGIPPSREVGSANGRNDGLKATGCEKLVHT